MEDSISALYTRLLGPPTKASEKRAQISGVGFGVSQGIMFLTYALTKPCQTGMLLHALLLHTCLSQCCRTGNLASNAKPLGSSTMCCSYALAFWYGGKEIASGDMSFNDVLKVCAWLSRLQHMTTR